VSDDYAIQVSFKTPTQTLINLRAADEAELSEYLDVLGRQLKTIGAVEQTLKAMENIYAGMTPAEHLAKQATAPAQSAPARPAAAPQAAQNAGDVPICEHGPMTPVSGVKNGRAWSGHFCPLPKGSPGQCAPVFPPFKKGS
jgi:hypothetical protein